MTTRVIPRLPDTAHVREIHRFLGALALCFIAVHVGAIVLDSYVHFGIADVLVPLAGHWHPLAVTFGVVALYLLIAVEATSLAMRHLPRGLWRVIHEASFLAYLLATLHLLTAGTEASVPAVNVFVILVSMAAAFLGAVRVAQRHDRTGTHAPEVDPAQPHHHEAAARAEPVDNGWPASAHSQPTARSRVQML